MFGFGAKKCFLCKQKIENECITKEVPVYGLVGKRKRDFCSEKHVKLYLARTEALMKTRRTCLSCKLK